LQLSRYKLLGLTTLLSKKYRVLLAGNAMESDDYHSRQSNDEFKNAWSFTSRPFLQKHGVMLEQRDKFIFTAI